MTSVKLVSARIAAAYGVNGCRALYHKPPSMTPAVQFLPWETSINMAGPIRSWSSLLVLSQYRCQCSAGGAVSWSCLGFLQHLVNSVAPIPYLIVLDLSVPDNFVRFLGVRDSAQIE